MSPLRAADDLDPLLERAKDKRCVLLGEASHGTSEYYRWRATITQRLVQEHGFRFVAVEGDWPDCQEIDRYVKDAPGAAPAAADALRGFTRWPTWMWANEEVRELAEWMRGFNEGHRHRAAGFHGLDVYSLWDSLRGALSWLEKEGAGDAADAARAALQCFEPYGEDEQRYAMATRWVPSVCEDQVVTLLARAREAALEDGAGGFDAEQNALVARNAERYYRAMVRGSAESWNVRDHHMMETLERLLAAYGPDAKAVVWAHNTHVGDARSTDMAEAGMTNLGQLARERLGEQDVMLVGFGSFQGSVIAGRHWGAPMQRMAVPPAREDSLEAMLHHESATDRLLFPPEDPRMQEWIGHRAIGVVYDPGAERWGNYVPTLPARRYDAFLYLDETRALMPLPVEHVEHGEEETFPFGV